MSKGKSLSAKVAAKSIEDKTVTAQVGLGQPRAVHTASDHVRATLLVTRRALAVATILHRAHLERALETERRLLTQLPEPRSSG